MRFHSFGANHHLRQSLVFLNMPILQQPEAAVFTKQVACIADIGLAQDATREFFKTFMAAFASWIGLVASTSRLGQAAA